MSIGNLSYFSIRNNFSVDSKAFLLCANFTAGALITLQGNTILHAKDPSPIYIGNLGPALVLDNTIISDPAQKTGPVVFNNGWADGDFVSIGNTYTVADPVKVPRAAAHLRRQDRRGRVAQPGDPSATRYAAPRPAQGHRSARRGEGSRYPGRHR